MNVRNELRNDLELLNETENENEKEKRTENIFIRWYL